MFRKFFIRAPAALLALALIFSSAFPLPAYAGSATPSDADYMDSGAHSLNYDFLASVVSDDGIALQADNGFSIPEISNSVNLTSVGFRLAYNNTQGGTTWPSVVSLSADGTFHEASRPSNYVSPYALQFIVYSGALPPTGNYGMLFCVKPDVGVSYTSNIKSVLSIRSYYQVSNSSQTYTASNSNSFLGNFIRSDIYQSVSGLNAYHDYYQNGEIWCDSAGDIWVHVYSVGIVNNGSSSLQLGLFTQNNSDSVSSGLVGNFSLQFIPVGTQPSYQMITYYRPSGEVQEDIASGVGQISAGVSQVVSGVSDVADKVSQVAANISQTTSAINALPGKIAQSLEPHYDNILTQLHHITEQLHAFWDQLAAYFNDKLIPQMITDTDRIVTAIENIDLEVNVSMTELMNKLDQNHKEQLENDNKNHQELVQGYDKSDLENSTGKLSDSMDEYESAENELLDDVKDNIAQMDYADPFTKVTGPLSDMSFFLTGIYTGLGDFSLPVMFSLTLSIALICIGWYRFRGG